MSTLDPGLRLDDAGVGGLDDLGEPTSLFVDALVCAFTVTLVEICCGWEFAADVVNSSCCTISTENLVRPCSVEPEEEPPPEGCLAPGACWAVHCSFTGGWS